MSLRHGFVTGLVKNVDDPDNWGRIQVEYPGEPGRSRTAWAPVAAPMAGNGRGFFFAPELEDEVILGFISGESDQPIIVGYTWNGADAPPTDHPRERIIHSLNHKIRLIDATPGEDGSGAVVIEDANNNKIVLSNGKITLKAEAMIELDAPVVKVTGPGRDRLFNIGNAVI